MLALTLTLLKTYIMVVISSVLWTLNSIFLSYWSEEDETWQEYLHALHSQYHYVLTVVD